MSNREKKVDTTLTWVVGLVILGAIIIMAVPGAPRLLINLFGL